MKIQIEYVLSFLILLSLVITGYSQNKPIILEAENSSLGGEFTIIDSEGTTYITPITNGVGGNPQSTARIASFSIAFEFAQTYDLYARVRVGNAGANDDSFYVGNGFGEKSVTDDNDWIRANNLVGVGYNLPQDFVEGAGGVGTNIWKWVNLSEFTGDEPPITFEVTESNSTLLFQIGAREDGLDIDKLAFARSDYFYTVKNLDNGEEGSPNKEIQTTQEPIAKGNDKFLGNIWSNSQAPGFLNYWNQVTPENAGKWGSVEQTRDNMNWSGLDQAYALARENGLPFRFHVLIWGNQQPAWIESLSTAEQLEEIKEWFQAVAARYPDIEYIEVVNEPLHDPPNSSGNGGGNYINALGGSGTTGWDWVIEAFRLAREAFPNAKLAINDYNIINSSENVTRYLQIINLLKAENLIDAIGFQAHAFSTTGSTSVMKNNLDRLAQTGLPLFASELDIDGPNDNKQLSDYQRIFPVIWEHPGVIGVTLWGYRPGLWRNDEKAYLIEPDGVTERPALIWLREYVEGTTTPVFDQLAADGITIYPNPIANRQFFIRGWSEKIHKVDVYTLNGRLISSSFPADERIQINGEIPGGIYLIRMIGDTRIITKKIIFR